MKPKQEIKRHTNPANGKRKRYGWARAAWIVVAVSLTLLAVGCSSVDFYRQAIGGQLSILMDREGIPDVVADPATAGETRDKLQLITGIRSYAAQLGLPVGDTYATYVDLGRPYVVWNVYAAPALSLESHTFCYFVVGCLSYKGFFDPAAAEAEAIRLQETGFDTYVGGVAAYSTLGWFDDPVLSTFLRRSDVNLAALIFHELAHKVLFIKGDTAFNEGFATAVEKLALRQWLEARNTPQLFADYEADEARHQAFVSLVLEYRAQLGEVYSSPVLTAEKLRRKQQVLDALRVRYGEVSESWEEPDTYSAWLGGDLNNARLSTVATYNQLVPAFMALHAQADDFEDFLARSVELSRRDVGGREAALVRLAEGS